MSKRLKNTAELAVYREKQLRTQLGVDPITGRMILAPVTDHDHVSGHCRKILDRSTNTVEGKVTNAFRRYFSHIDRKEWPDILTALADYWRQDFRNNPLYPTHINVELRKYKLLPSAKQCAIVRSIGGKEENCKNAKVRTLFVRKHLLKKDLTIEELFSTIPDTE